MKLRQILYKIILIVILSIICNSCMCYAAPSDPSHSVQIDDGSSEGGAPGLNINTGLFKPTLTVAGKINEIISGLLGALIVLGAITTVVSIAIIGFDTILGSASEKAEYKQKLVGVIFGAIVLMCGSTIARVLISVAESL